jgi:hypothetical protein
MNFEIKKPTNYSNSQHYNSDLSVQDKRSESCLCSNCRTRIPLLRTYHFRVTIKHIGRHLTAQTHLI